MLKISKFATNCSENHFKEWLDNGDDNNTLSKYADNEILKLYENFTEINKRPMRKAEN